MKTDATPSFFKLRSAWVCLWSVPALALLTHSLLTGQGREGLTWLGQFLLALFVSLFTFKKGLHRVLVTILLFFLASAALEPLLVERIWQDPQTRDLTSTLQDSQRNLVTRTSVRSWRAPPEDELELSFESRVAEGRTGWDWFRSTGGFKLTPLTDRGKTFTRVETPTGGDPYLMRTFDLRSPAGGRTFKVDVEMRAPEMIEAKRCRGVWLQTWGPGGEAACQDVALGPEWKSFDLTWTAPPASTSHIVRVILNDFDGLRYDVRNVKLFERRAGTWLRLEPLLEEGAAVKLSLDAGEPAAYGFVPESTWRPFSFTLTSPNQVKSLRAFLSVGSSQSSHTTVELRRTRVTTGERDLKPQPTFKRSQLWFSHPNLAAHTILSVSLVALAGAALLRTALALCALAGFLLLSVGSRAALLAFGFGTAWLLWLLRKQRRWLTGVTALGFVLSVGLILTGHFQSALLTREGTSRLDIWHVAAQAVLAHPWRGVDFPSYWGTAYRGDSTELVTHAHNFWLYLASRHGVSGLLVALWITGGLVYIAWRWGRWRGLALVTPVLLMNVFDYTLFYSGVLLPLILGLNALREEAPGEDENAPQVGLR